MRTFGRLVLCTSVLLSANVFGQGISPVAPRKGAFSASFAGEWFDVSPGGYGSSFSATPAYFAMDRVEVRVPFLIDKTTAANETAYGLGLRYHMAKRGANGVNSLLDPFIGPIVEHARAAHGYREDFTGVQAGAHYFLANNVALTGLMTFGWDRANGATMTTVHLTAGFTIFFAPR